MAASPAAFTTKLSSLQHLLRYQIAASNTTRSTLAATAAAASTTISVKPVFNSPLAPLFNEPQAESSDVVSPLVEGIDWRLPLRSYSSPMSKNPVSADPSRFETGGGSKRVFSDEDEDDDEYSDVDCEFVDDEFVDEDDDNSDEEEDEEEEEQVVRRRK
ncbi:hypothetical protein Ancab_012085 [Ancistrocladus abbreviatus]